MAGTAPRSAPPATRRRCRAPSREGHRPCRAHPDCLALLNLPSIGIKQMGQMNRDPTQGRLLR